MEDIQDKEIEKSIRIENKMEDMVILESIMLRVEQDPEKEGSRERKVVNLGIVGRSKILMVGIMFTNTWNRPGIQRTKQKDQMYLRHKGPVD